ncbi:restriction endonuclease subunit S [Arthrobacter sp. B6]|uniref:restriction endonuclease subunit S n=1 Tax=Arthrobacter sp. B6 TaxID=1570137 RepID=UPI000836A86F|nr:restriction endonuclease subunit S [Arthrobacter sp. B6]
MSELTVRDMGTLFDGPHATPTRIESGPYFLNIASLSGGRLELDQSDHVSEADFEKWTKRVEPTEGDLLFSYETRLGEAALMPAGVRACLGRRMALIRPNRSVVNPKFLLYYYLSPGFQRTIEQHTIHGATVNRISLSTMGAWPVALPSLGEQQAIAEVLGALDDKIAANTKLAATASELAGLKYDHSAADFDARPMSDVLTPVLGGTPARSRADFWGGDRLWASAKDITGAQFGVVLSTDEKITEGAVAGTKAKPLPAGSVILTARGTVGAVARLAAPASFNQSCYGFVPGAIPPGVLYFAITRAVLRAKEIAHGSVFDTITMKTFDHLPFPDFDAEALAATECEMGPLLEVVAGVVRENSSLAEARDTLLPQLMSGKLRVKDAEKVLENAGV